MRKPRGTPLEQSMQAVPDLSDKFRREQQLEQAMRAAQAAQAMEAAQVISDTILQKQREPREPRETSRTPPPRATSRSISPRQQPRSSKPVEHKKDRRCQYLVENNLWKYAKYRASISRDEYENVIRPCFVFRLLDAARQKNRAHRDRRYPRELEDNWSHDVVLAQYAKIAERMGDYRLANVLNVMPNVEESIDRYTTNRPPIKRQQKLNRNAAFSRNRESEDQWRYREARSSQNTYRGLKDIVQRLRL